MATATGNYSFEILETITGPVNPKSRLPTITVVGNCTDKDDNTFGFVVANNVDSRYPERFKVNWNGTKPRMPVVVGFGLKDDVQAKDKVSDNLYFTRGARIAIARMAKLHVGKIKPVEYSIKELRTMGKELGLKGLSGKGMTKDVIAARVLEAQIGA